MKPFKNGGQVTSPLRDSPKSGLELANSTILEMTSEVLMFLRLESSIVAT